VVRRTAIALALGAIAFGCSSSSPAALRTLPPGSLLPSGAACAERVGPGTRESRPDNNSANHRRVRSGIDYNLPNWDEASFGMNPAASAFRERIDGAFEGTTDAIIRWGACKWGFDEDVVRAIAMTESSWRQSFEGDPTTGSIASPSGFQSFGLLQVKKTTHPGTFPASQLSTAFNVDYALAYRRACYEGYLDWLRRNNAAYVKGDEWGCVAHWFSGGWHDADGEAYIGRVKAHLHDRLWTTFV
jgi:hypothetical protein